MSAANPSLHAGGGKIVSHTGMMVYPWGVHKRKLVQRLNPGQYIAPPSGYTVKPRTPYVKSEWEEAAEQLERQNNSSSIKSSNNTSRLIDPKKLLPPFVPGEGDRSLTYLRNNAATKPATMPLQKSLLPYKIRRTAAKSLLHGGVRTTGLTMPYPSLAVTHSEELALPTLHEERRDLKWDAADFPMHLMPINMANDFKHQAMQNRSEDLYRRLQKEMDLMRSKVYLQNNKNNKSDGKNINGNKSTGASAAVVFKSKSVRYLQPHSSSLRIEPYTEEEWQQIREDSAEARRNAAILDSGSVAVDENGNALDENYSNTPAEGVAAPFTQKEAYLPFQSFKPHNYGVWRITGRNGSPVMAQMSMKGERNNRKGFGWKSLSNKMWQLDLDSWRHMPDMGYLKHRK